jgi:hypothetical protein
MTKQRRLRPSQGGKMDRTSGPAGSVDPSEVPSDAEAAGDVHVVSRRQLDALWEWVPDDAEKAGQPFNDRQKTLRDILDGMPRFVDPGDVKHAEFHRVDWPAPPAKVLQEFQGTSPFTLRRDAPDGPVVCGYEKSDDACMAMSHHWSQDNTRPLFVVDRSGAIHAKCEVWEP